MSRTGKRFASSLVLRWLGLLGLFSLAASLPAVWLMWEADVARERATLIAQSAADQVQAGIREQIARFDRATAGLRAQDAQGEATLLSARLLRMEPIIAPAIGLSVINARGTQIASTVPSNTNAAAPEWLRRATAAKTRDPFILGPETGSDGQNWILARRIEDGQGATVGVVASILPAQALKALITPVGMSSAFLTYSASDGTGAGQLLISPEPAVAPQLSPALTLVRAWLGFQGSASQPSSFTAGNLHWIGAVDPAAVVSTRASEIERHGWIVAGITIALVTIGILLTVGFRTEKLTLESSQAATDPGTPAAKVEAEVLRQQLGELAQERDRVLAAIGHDVRTPINSILGICALLLDGDLDEGQRKWLQRIRASCEALLAMLNGMLEIAAARVDGAEVHNEPVDLANLIEEVGEVLRPQAHDKGLEFQVAIEESLLGTWSTDPTRLRQVLFNLAGNAIKYTMHGSVEIRALACSGQAGQEMLELRVSDTGPGIADDERELIFTQFRRGRDEVSRGQEGLGLGLALCREIAALLGGTLSLESTLSVGSVFTFQVPMERVQSPRSRGLLAGRTALVVGLSEGLRRRAASHLEGMGFDVETAGDGFMALGAAERAAYQHGTLDLLVLDAALAGLPADALMLRLQANRWFERTRTVVVSNGKIAASIEGRADLVVAHPVEASDLDRAVGALFETSSPLLEIYPRAPRSPKQRILVVEDNRINQALFLDVLGRANFSAFAASSGEEAVQAVERGGFDLILMDVQMPGIDGTEATRRIRAMGSQRSVPIVGLTAHSGAVMRKHCLDAGMNLVLHKPVDLSRLPLRLREVINAVRPMEEPVDAGDQEREPSLDIADEYIEVLIAELGVERGRTCLTGFLADTAIHIPTLREQADAENWDALAGFAHNLAGAASTLGAAAFGDALLMAEDFARAKDKARLLSALNEVEAVWDRTRLSLRSRFDMLAAKRSGSLKDAA